ncbi:MAG: YdcF family protein [Thermoanaerobaculia bacterium]
MPARSHATFLQELGPGGASTLALAFFTGVVGLGMPVAWRLRQVLREAARDERAAADAVLILGRELVDDRPTATFRARLEHGARLWHERLAPRVIVSGGWTGRASRSEAEAGSSVLIELGVPAEDILVEDRSRHTLENLVFVRDRLRAAGWQRIILVSDPLHLARVRTLASGLAMSILCSPARQAPPLPGGPAWWLRAVRESFLLHWYHVGVGYSRAIGSERLLSRVR